MTSLSPLALALMGIVLLASARAAVIARRRQDHAWRIALLMLGQAACAVLLYFTLLPPPVPAASGRWVVLTQGAREPTDLAAGDVVLALPEAPRLANVRPVPDLGTALRRHPQASRLDIVGEGLPPRDRDAARGLRLTFSPSALPDGLVELSAPTQATAGRRWQVRGRIEGGDAVTVQLLDPAGNTLSQAKPDRSGRFALSATAGVPGRVDYRLQWLDASKTVREDAALPMDLVAGAPLRLWLLAGGPSPETKYLRRWALDAGLTLRTQISAGGGLQLGDPALPVNAATLRDRDVVVLDERAWRTLGAAGRATLRQSVREGLGVLLRITGDLSAADRAALREWGFDVAASDLPRSVRLPGTELADARARGSDVSDGVQATDTAPVLSRRPLAVSAADGVPLLRDTRGDTLALWRPEGRGRVALWLLSDSYRLTLADRGGAYGNLWAESLETLSRPAGTTPLAVPKDVRASERSALCGITEESTLRAPDGSAIALAIDPSSGCAAFWPSQAGWHELVSGEHRAAFPVRGEDELPGLRAAERQSATQVLAAATSAARTGSAPPTPGERWPWALAWILLSAALWWGERSRRGRRAATAQD